MPLLYRYTHEAKKKDLYEKMLPENLEGVFTTGMPGNLDLETANKIREAYKIYWETWIQPEAAKYLLPQRKINTGPK